MLDLIKSVFDPGDWLAMKPALDPAAKSLSLNHRPDPFHVKLQIGVGAGVLLTVALVIYFLGEEGMIVFVACGFGAVALFNLVYGIIQSRFEKALVITDTMVLAQTRSLLGLNKWQEPLSNYRGVVMREERIRQQSVGNDSASATFHIIELAHPRPDRTVPLVVRLEGKPPRDLQEAFARRFALPALAPDESGEAARPPDALDVPIIRQSVPAADPGKPPSGVVTTREGGTVRIVVGPGRLMRAFALMSWLAIPLIFGFVAGLADPEFAYIAFGMALVFVLLVLGIGAFLGSGDRPRSICIDAQRVWIDAPRDDVRRSMLERIARRFGPAGSSFDLNRGGQLRSLDLRDVEQIRVDHRTSHGSSGSSVHARLVIEGDTGRLDHDATQFDGAKLEWVRDYLLFALGNSARAD